MSALSSTFKIFIIVVCVLTFSSFFYPKEQAWSVFELRNNYVQALKSFDGALYSPPDEGTGISCSQLVWKSLVKTKGINLAFRQAIESDNCFSEDLDKGCNQELEFIEVAKNLQKLDYNKIELGDVAVLGSAIGVHSMAYIGDQTWIHADPIAGKVIESQEENESSDWDNYEVKVWRWNVLSDR